MELVTGDEEVIGLSPRVRRLLAALTVRAGAVASSDWLVEAVWGMDAPGAPEAALQTVVSRLRAALRGVDGVAVVTRATGYALTTAADAVDAARFDRLVAAAQTDDDPRRRRDLLQRAVGLWRGPAYADYADLEFAEAEAARLTELRTVAREDLAELDLARGRPAAALSAVSALAREHPFREAPHRLLMLAQYRSGRTAEALETYTALRRRMLDELGLEPSSDLVALQQDILNDAPRLAADPQPGGAPGPWPVPPRPGPLIGRDRERDEVVALLDQSRLVTVLGPGGLGKTSLARQVLADLADRFPGATAVCELTGVPTGATLPAALCTMLRVPARGQEDAVARLLTALGDRELLVLLDNCEHLVAEVAQIAATLLRECPRVRLLTTSRVPLRLPDELVHTPPPLLPPDPLHAGFDELRASPAVQLFLTRARQRARDFTADDDRLRPVAALCRRLDGLPLAIELAASQMAALSPEELLERLPWRLTVLRAGPGTDPRHRTLRALVDWSFDRLSPSEQELFETVSVFAGSFRLADVEALLAGVPSAASGPGDLVADLASLIEQSMITRTADTGTSLVLETLRTYGRERLAAGPRGDAVARAHAELYARIAEDGFPDLYGPSHLAQLARLEAAMEELRTAFWWSVPRDLPLAGRLVGNLAVLVEHKLVGEVAGWADQLIAAAGGHGPQPSARVFAVAASGQRFGGNLGRAATLARQARDLAGDDVPGAVYAISMLSETDFFAGDLDAVPRHRDDAQARAGDDPRVRPMLAMLDGAVLLAEGYGGEVTAAARARDLQALAHRHGWPVVAAWATYVRGELLRDRDPEQADGLLEEALRQARDLDERYLYGVALVSAASIRSRHGDPEQARQLFVEVVRHWRGQGNWTHQWTTLRNVLDLWVRTGRTEPAAVLAEALLDSGRAATGYGADAARLTDSAAALARELGPEQHAELRARAHSLDDDAVVQFVLATLSRP